MRFAKAFYAVALLGSLLTAEAASTTGFGFSSVERVGNTIVLSWPKILPAARAETMAGTNGVWTPLVGSPELKGDFYVAAQEISGQLAFFQLVTSSSDADADGLPDSWELAQFGSLSAESALSDYDGDGILNIEEFQNGSNPTKRDDREPMGPSSRKTAIVITEIHYNPASGPKFIEVYNSDIVACDLAGYRLQSGSGSNLYTFAAAPESVLAPGAYRAVMVPTLSKGGQTIRLISKSGAAVLEISYKDDAPWPCGPDGFGPSLTLKNPSYGENDPRAWGASWENGGTPGSAEPTTPDLYAAIKLNEFVANPATGSDIVELFNRSNVEVDLTGCVLKDSTSSSTLTGPIKIPARGFRVFSPPPFGLDASGERISLWSPQGRLIDAVKYGPQKLGVSMGRYPDGEDDWQEQKTITKGAANSGLKLPDIVINEIMFHSPWGQEFQYVELKNVTANAKNLFGLRLGGAIQATLPAVSIPADGYFLVVKNFAAMQAAYGSNWITAENTVQWTSGVLGNNGARIILQSGSGVVYDEVTYSPAWGQYSDGGGSSLELIDPHSDNRLGDNWAGSDETAKGAWVTLQLTGERAHAFNNSGPKGYSGFNTTSSQVDFMLLSEGDVLIDDISVTEPGTANRVANPSFTSGALNWEFRGTHDSSARMTNGGAGDSPCLKVHSTGRADNVYGKVTGTLSPAIALTGQATLSAKVRWLGGSPYFVMRFRENSLELAGNLMNAPASIPMTLGTPLAQNSRYAANGNTGPAFLQVRHRPVLPRNQDVIVTAKVADPDGISSVVLKYRIDPSQTFTSVPMNDTGDFFNFGDSAAHDGVYSARIPKQASGTMVAFYVEATDNASPSAIRDYPATPVATPCLIRFGEVASSGDIPTYRIWTTQATMSRWTTREQQHNTPLDCTFVYNDRRVIYNCGVMYGGGDYTVLWYDKPTGNLCTYDLVFPELNRLLGDNEATLDPPKYDSTMVTEKTSYLVAEELGVPAASSRFIHVTINGVPEVNRPSPFGPSGRIYEDRTRVGKSFLKTWFPSGDESDGPLFKIEVWNEQKGTEVWPMPYVSATLGNFVAESVKRRARYRWTFLDRTHGDDPHTIYDTALYPLIDAVNDSTTGYVTAVENEADTEKWMACFAYERSVGNDDAYGVYSGHNIYMFKPVGKKWQLIPWDMERGFGIPSDTSNVLLSPTDSLFSIISGTNPQWEPEVWRMFQTARFQRAYWRAFRAAVDGPLITAGAKIDSYFNALVARSIWPANQQPEAVRAGAKDWASKRRNYILSQLSANDSVFQITSNAGQDFTTSQASYALSGTAPFSVVRLTTGSPGSEVNQTVTWDFLDSGAIKQKPGKWTMNVDLAAGPNVITVNGYDKSDLLVGTDTITITRQ